MVFHKKIIAGAKRIGIKGFLFDVTEGRAQQFTVPFGSGKTFALKGLKAIPKILTAIPKVQKGAVRGLITALTLPTLIGLAFSPFGKKTLKASLDPVAGFQRGKKTPEFISGVLEDVREGITPSGFKEGLQTAGLIGGGVALAGAGLVVGKKVIEKFKSRDSLLGNVPLAPFPITSQALQPVKQIPVEKPLEVKQPKPVVIKNIFKPSVDIRFSKTRKFINQQVLIK